MKDSPHFVKRSNNIDIDRPNRVSAYPQDCKLMRGLNYKTGCTGVVSFGLCIFTLNPVISFSFIG